MGFNVTDTCLKKVNFINFVRPEQSQGSDTAGYMSDPCADPNGIEFGSCSLSLEDFGRYGRQGPVRDTFKPERYCEQSPRYMYDGSMITDERMWDMAFTMDTLLNDIRKDLITGNNTTTGQFDGLQRWVRTGYDCPGLDSDVIDWNANYMRGGSGITLNGQATPSGNDIVDWLLYVHRNIKQRISQSPLLSNQQRQVGDTILVMPNFMVRCLLDFYTCWSVCPGAQYEEVVKDTRDMREFRLTLNGGLFGDGQISLDGESIPILAYDWNLINGPNRGDMYYLTGSIGNQRIWEGEHLSAAVAQQELTRDSGGRGYFSTDGGRVLGWQNVDSTCTRLNLMMRPRIWCMAPWAQVRFQNVACRQPGGPLSPDPADSSFYPHSSFNQATCP
jgi:hypothetical protein